MKYTIELIKSYHPCGIYTDERLAALWAGRESLTAQEIAGLDIPIEDRIWVFLQDEHRDAITKKIVTRAVTNHCLNCGVPTVEQWAKDWLSNDPNAAARDAAYAAAYAAADARAARDAAYAAADARAAYARAVAYAARDARAAAYAHAAAYAARDAAYAAADAERELQLQDCLNVILEGATPCD